LTTASNSYYQLIDTATFDLTARRLYPPPIHHYNRGTELMPRLIAKPLTQKIIDTTTLPKTRFTLLRDPDQRGLSVRVWASGARTWTFEYRSPVSGRNARIGLPYGSLADARARAKELRAAIGNGRDPSLDARRGEGRDVVAVAGALDLYEAAVVKPAARATSRRARMASLRKTLEPFNGLPIAQLKRGAIVLRLDEVQAIRGPIARNRAQSEIRHWLGWLHNRGLVETIELALVRKDVKETARERVLTDTELTVIVAVTADHTPFSDIIRVLLHTGMRRGEAANLQPRDLDFDAMTIRVREEVSKTKQTRLIPLDEAIATMLAERAERVGQEQYIFGDGSDFRRPFTGWGKRVAALVKAMPKGERWTLHDIRRTVATRLYSAGVDPLVIEDLLGHTTGVRSGVKGVYNRAETLARQRPALRQWAIKLAALKESQKQLVSAR
jgi:integrase